MSAAFILAVASAWMIFDGGAIKAKAVLSQILLERAWKQTVAGEQEVKPWPWADVWPVAKIEAPHLGKSTIVLSGVSGQALAFGPGHLQETAEPGEPGMAIIAAHRDTHFRFLKDIKIGDVVAVTNRGGERLSFIIRETRVVDANASGLVPDTPTPIIALVTCWPFDAKTRGPNRFVAIGELII